MSPELKIGKDCNSKNLTVLFLCLNQHKHDSSSPRWAKWLIYRYETQPQKRNAIELINAPIFLETV